MAAPANLNRKRLGVTGVVQGVGFRPFVYRLAQRHNLTGWVRNTSRGVEIEVEGPPAALDTFIGQLSHEAPALARVDSVSAFEALPLGEGSFQILGSDSAADTEALIPGDVGTCAECAQEVLDPRERRYHYPFTNCTNCGPRLTLIQKVPYDRANTTMAAFAMCEECRREYQNPADRRFHAEPIACPRCGPQVWLEDKAGRSDSNALAAAGRLLHEGQIVAVKGLGGFHLACDARREDAVQTLRQRKGRGDKPLAVMVRDLAEAERVAEIGDLERSLLLSPERPIVLAKTRAAGGIAANVAPNNNYLGLLLPYTPLHLLLFEQAPGALIMTSGNLSEEPLVFTNEEARVKLSPLADALLLHDRDIQIPCDDSLVRPLNTGEVIPLRRARGYVPRTIPLPLDSPPVLGVGAEQKNTFCLAWDGAALVSHHLGDLDTVETYDYFRYAIDHFQALTRKDPVLVAHDLHPLYLSSQYAKERPEVRRLGVQHHHAHIAACLAENGHTDRCIGIALDGTGYGPDGTVWGGEILIADLTGYVRAGHFAQVRLPGGEAAVRHPGRMAAAYLYAIFGEDFTEVAARLDLTFTPFEQRVLRRQLATGWQAPLTSSAGRLFDAVAAALNVCRRRTYEGQPALELEMVAAAEEDGFYPAPVRENRDHLILDTLPIFKSALEDLWSGTPLPLIAARFHQSLARLLAKACATLRERTGLNLVALSGGVFQNARLLTGLKQLLHELDFEVLTHNRVPPNDGGISLGQAAIAAARLKEEGW
ncbi:MAG: carbamoyltransferase HypF [Thermodesulfobacteriota bacterium]